MAGYNGRILGISIDSPAPDLIQNIRQIAIGAAQLLGLEATSAGEVASAPSITKSLSIDVNADYLGGGYAVVGDLERDAIYTVARAEGLLLDPVYTGRAFGALLDLIRRGSFTKDQRILFWHTGGAAALSAFANELHQA
jgi:L-cysteate sulfo-lyase